MKRINASELEEIIISSCSGIIFSSDEQKIKYLKGNSKLFGFLDDGKLKGYELDFEKKEICKIGEDPIVKHNHKNKITAVVPEKILITGEEKGRLVIWHDKPLHRQISDDAITAITTHKNFIYCGTSKGDVIKVNIKSGLMATETIATGWDAVRKLLIDDNDKIYILNSQLCDQHGNSYGTHIKDFTLLDNNLVIARDLGPIKYRGRSLPDSERKPYSYGRHHNIAYSNLMALDVVTYKGKKHIFGCYKRHGKQIMWDPESLEAFSVIDGMSFDNNPKENQFSIGSNYRSCNVVSKQ